MGSGRGILGFAGTRAVAVLVSRALSMCLIERHILMGRLVIGKKRYASIPISTIRDFRHGDDISPYRTSLHFSPLVEPRWMTIIYLLPSSAPIPPLSFINSNISQTPAYKLAHLIAPTEETFELWKDTLSGFLDERKSGVEGGDWEELRWREAGGASGVPSPECLVVADESSRVVKEDEVLRLCRRLGVGIGKDQIASAFRVRLPSSSLRMTC